MSPRVRHLAVCSTALAAAALGQQEPPPASEWLTAAAIEARLDGPAPWHTLLDRSTLSVGRYRLAAGAADGQQPHNRDEVYYVVGGKARFTVGAKTQDVGAGDLLFVAAAAPHRFHDVTQDLDLLVFFSTATPATGGMAAGPKPTEQTPYDETSARGATRIFYWYGPSSAGQLVLDHGRPRWNADYERFLTEPSGRRWRFGENSWTTLDTNIPLTLGGVDIAPGLYYVVLQNTAARGLELVLLDPEPIRARRLDAYQAAETRGGIAVPLQREEAPHQSGRLAVAFAVDRSRDDRGELRIHFGPHLLRTDLVMHPTQAEAGAAPADVGSVDAIVKALYDVISGPAGQPRDWRRMRSLFHRDAELIPIVKAGEDVRAAPMSVARYIERSGPFLEQSGFFEQEIARRVETFGDFAHVWSTYEGRRAMDDATPFLRGINSIQLVREGGRWYVLQVLWEQEADAGPIPADYLPGK